MNGIQITTKRLDEHVDVLELAILTQVIWKITNPDRNASIEGIGSWIQNLRYDDTPVVVQAYKENNLVGWLLLFVHDSRRLEINPWALGGHPLIHPNEPRKSEIARLLFTECINYAQKTQYTRIELCYEKKDNIDEYPVNPSLYPKCHFVEEDEVVFMSQNLKDQEFSEEEFPEEMNVFPLKEADDDKLYSCFYDSFSESGDRNFLSETDEERKEYFNEHFDKEDEIVDEASIVLQDGNRIIGFTLVKPTHGEGNGHLWVMGVIPEYRRHKLGSKLLNHARANLKKQGYKTMSLVVDSANEAALKLYEKFSFEKGWQRVTHVWKKK